MFRYIFNSNELVIENNQSDRRTRLIYLDKLMLGYAGMWFLIHIYNQNVLCLRLYCSYSEQLKASLAIMFGLITLLKKLSYKVFSVPHYSTFF